MGRWRRITLTEETQVRIRAQAASGVYYRDIALAFGLKPNLVSKVLSGTYEAPEEREVEPLKERPKAQPSYTCGNAQCIANLKRTRKLLGAQIRERGKLQKRYAKIALGEDSALIEELQRIKRIIQKLLGETNL